MDPIEVIGGRADKHTKRRLDLAEVVGQVEAKWACEVAAAGRHHMLSVARLGSVVAEIARLGRTLRAWRDQLLAYFSTGRAAAPKPSTASSNSTAGSPADSATPATTDYG